MIRLIASDLDGTLLQNGAQSLTWETVSAIREWTNTRGILFAAASGRQYPNLYRLFGSAAGRMAFLCENGALVFYEDRLLSSTEMDADIARAIGEDILSADGCELLISGRRTSYLIPKDPSFYDRMKYVVKNEVAVLGSFSELPEPCYKISAYERSGIATGHGPALIRRWERDAKCTISGREWLDFVHPSVNKGAALSALCDRLDILPSECAAFGDNYNDLEMLSFVGHGYVMENAAEEIRRRFPLHSRDVVATVRNELL